MYTLYVLPGACSLAVHVVLRELAQDVTLIHRDSVRDYRALNPVGTVPTLVSDNLVLRESVSMILYLLEKHRSDLLPTNQVKRRQALEDLLFANATLQPAYGRLYFLNRHAFEPSARQAFVSACKRRSMPCGRCSMIAWSDSPSWRGTSTAWRISCWRSTPAGAMNSGWISSLGPGWCVWWSGSPPCRRSSRLCRQRPGSGRPMRDSVVSKGPLTPRVGS